MNDDLIYRQQAIDLFNDSAELLRRVLDDTDIVGAERKIFEWELRLTESYISDLKELPSADVRKNIKAKKVIGGGEHAFGILSSKGADMNLLDKFMWILFWVGIAMIVIGSIGQIVELCGR